jgi:CxxC motif-containing protein (DUF1111 family)
MAVRFPSRPAHWVALALVLAPAWKVIEWSWGTRPKVVSASAVAAGEELFRHVWTPYDPLTSGDGLGPVFNASSCVECHSQGGIGGAGPLDKNVTVYGLPSDQPNPKGLPTSGVVHQRAVKPEFQETLAQVHAALPALPYLSLETLLKGHFSRSTGVQIGQRNTPALFGDGLIDAIPDNAIIAHQREHSDAARLVGLNGAKDNQVRGRVARLADGRVGKFGWKGEFATLGEFVKAACANEIGLSNPGRDQATPLPQRDYKGPGTDLTAEQCELMTDFLRGLSKPEQIWPSNPVAKQVALRGGALFEEIGCADCHSPKLGSVEGLYSDLLLHDMGSDLESSPGSYGQPPVRSPNFANDPPGPGEWRTPPLWGVADSGPYLHDGRSPTLEDAIKHHGGEASGVALRFDKLPSDQQAAVVAFLKTLRAPRTPVSAVASR